MPHGGARHGAGRKQKPVEHHVRAGTYRPDRHGLLPANVLPMPAQITAPWKPTDDELTTIGSTGRVFITETLARYEFSFVESRILLEAAQAVCGLAAVRSVGRSGRTLRELATLDRMELAWMKQFAALLAQLKVQP